MRKKISSLFILSVAALLSVFTACNKLSKSTNVPVDGPVVIKSNVIVVDTAQYRLVSSPAQLTQGTYVYLYKASLADMRHNGDFNTGSIIIGTSGEGYLRKIISSVNDVESITLNTQQARLEDIFQEGTITFSAGTVDGSMLQYNFNNDPLFTNGSNSIKAVSGNVSLSSLINYTMQFRDGSIRGFDALCNSGNLGCNVLLNVNAASGSSFAGSDTIKTIKGLSTIWIKNVPLIISTELSLVASITGNTTGALNDNITISNNEPFTLNTSYTNGAWMNNYTLAPVSSITASVTPAAPAASITCDIIPRLSVRFYGMTGSSLTIPVKTSLEGSRSLTTTDWDFLGNLYLQPAISEVAAILGYSLPDYNTFWSTESSSYLTPYQVLKVSGDNQAGTANHYLAQPVVIRVIDNKGNKQPGVPVYFTVTTGGGSLSYYTTVTNADGIASGYWQLGNASGHQTVSVVVKKANNTQVPGSPVVFTAN